MNLSAMLCIRLIVRKQLHKIWSVIWVGFEVSLLMSAKFLVMPKLRVVPTCPVEER